MLTYFYSPSFFTACLGKGSEETLDPGPPPPNRPLDRNIFFISQEANIYLTGVL